MAPSSFVHVWQGKSTPLTLLLLHGTGGDERDLLSLGEAIHPEANLLGVRGNSREEGVNRFFRRKSEGILDEDDIRIQNESLKNFVIEVSSEYKFSLDKTVAVGYSNGANIAASLLLLDPELLAGAILLRPMAPFQLAQPHNGPSGPVLILAGRSDQMIPASSTQFLIQELRARGSKVEVVVQNAGHNLIREDLTESKRWFANHFLASSDRSLP